MYQKFSIHRILATFPIQCSLIRGTLTEPQITGQLFLILYVYHYMFYVP